MKRLLFLFLLWPLHCYAGFSNSNSILIGERAAGMGGAYTALTDDPAGGSFYNPASLALMKGGTLSAAVNAYHKYETVFGKQDDFSGAAFRVNQGSIVPIPASSGTVYSFGEFAVGLSILFPDFEIYNGDINKKTNNTSVMNLRDESLWVGGSVALKFNARNSFGMSVYYTSRTYSRSINDLTNNSGNITQSTEEKNFSHNNLVYILGYQHKLNNNWSLGLSARLPSIPISGVGTFARSEIVSPGSSPTPVSKSSLSAETKIPTRYALGIGYEQAKKWAFSFDLSYHAPEEYKDLEDDQAGQIVEYKPTFNANMGTEYYWKKWLAFRFGLYSNLSLHPQVKENPSARSGDHIDMWGWSANAAIYTSKNSVFTLGGYYTGGKGFSVQQVNQSLVKTEKNLQIFAFLVATSFNF